MAKTRKSARRSGSKKRSAAKRASAKKRPARKAPAKRSAKSAAAGRARKSTGRTRRPNTLGGVARGGIETVRQVGDRAWDALRSTTAQVVEGVRERFGDDSERDLSHRRGD
jgi:hypothetical protein